MATLTCPTCRTPFQQGDLICLTCGANLARVRGAARAEEPVQPQGPPQGQQYQPPAQGQQPPPAYQAPPAQGQQPPPAYQAPPAQGQQPYQPEPPQPIPAGGPPPGAGPGQPPQQQFPPLQPPGVPPYPPQYHAEPYASAGGPQGAPQQPMYEPPPPGQPQPYDQPDPYQAPPAHYEPPPPAQYEPPPQYEQQQAPPYGGQQGFGQPPPYEPTFDHPSPGQPSPFERPYAPGPPGYGPPDMPPRVGPPMPPRPAREETLLPPEGGQVRNQAMAAESTAAMCPYCEAVLANPAAAQCDNCLRPLSRQQPPPQQPAAPAAPPMLRLQFPNGELQLQLGQHLVLGRDAGQSPVAGTFTQYDNVSRRHTTVWLDQSGTAWCRDERSTNGTFVNGERLPAGVEAPLRDGDSLRLAADVTAAVRLS